MNLKWLFPRQRSSRGRERERLSTINALWRIQNFTMIVKNEKHRKQYAVAKQKKKSKKPLKKVIEV